MPRPKSVIPKLCHDRTRNRAFCKVDGRFIVLGPWGSPEAQAAYGKLLEDLAAGRQYQRAAQAPAKREAATVQELLLAYATKEAPRYARDEQHCIRGAIRFVRELYGETDANDFGPLRLRAVRDAMLDKGWSVCYTNRQVKRIRQVFKWGVSLELVSAVVLEALRTVPSLPETGAAERARHAVPDADLQAVRAVLSEFHRDIFDLMLLTGCRSGELVNLKVGDIDRSGEIWRADLSKHKTAHKGKGRTLFFNASAQLILRKYLQANPAAKLFTIRRDYFGKVVKTACGKAGVKEFTPHWLRHTVATRLADELGTEAAQRLLGHATKAMTEHYSKSAEKVAIEAVKRLG